MNKIKLAFAFTFGVLFFACEKDKTEVDFSIVPVKGTNGEYQYIDLSQKGKIVINPQFGEAHVFRCGLARVKTSGKDGKFGYIDKKGKFAINPAYGFGQDFSDDVAWVQLEDQPPMLIDKSGKTLLQIDSLVEATPFSNGIAGIIVYSKGQVLPMFINKKGEQLTIATEGQAASLFINDDRYAFKNNETGKFGYKNLKGETIVNEQFDEAYMFFKGTAVVRNGNKWGVIDKQGNFIINPQYDALDNDSDGLFIAKVGEKYGWINKKGEIVINPQFDNLGGGFYGNSLAPVQIGSKFGYIDKTGQIVMNPQFDGTLPFNGDYAMVVSGMKIGFIDKKGNFVVDPLYDGNLSATIEYAFANSVFNLVYAYENIKKTPEISVYWNVNFLDYKTLKEKKNAWAEELRKSSNFTDHRDGKKYKVVKIGNQVWMAENLNFDVIGSVCYDNNSANCNKYGRLYNWNTAKTVCPSGWHLPTSTEWDVLIKTIGGFESAGKYLKTKSGWNNNKGKSGNGQDAFGFAALPGGSDNLVDGFNGDGYYGSWWTASEHDASKALRRAIRNNEDGMAKVYDIDKSYLFSIRCVKDVRQ